MASGHKHLDTLQSKTSDHDLGYHGKQNYDPYAPRRDTDTKSESERAYSAQPYKSSNDSLFDQQRAVPSEALNPTFNDYAPPPPRESYPAWGIDRQVPLSTEEIEDVFLDLTQKFGFQHDSMRNQFDFLMQLLDSRASRMPPLQALTTLHADYIGGPHANYRKWYFAVQLDLDDAVGQTQNPGVKRLQAIKRTKGDPRPATGAARSLENAINRWRQSMQQMSPYDRLRQIALYLLCWGEAAQVRFVPECLCFIFKCADDYYRSPECQNRQEPVPEGLYLMNVVKPLYCFLRDQGYEIQDGKFVRREKDHEGIIGYDDVNQLFWYPEGIARIVLNDRIRLVDLPPAQRFMKFNKVDWGRTFFKTYKEKRTSLQLLVHFNRIWILHVSLFWYYTAYNSPTIYRRFGATDATAPMKWSASALGGAVSTMFMILATFAEFTFIPTTWDNTSHLFRRLIMLFIVLGLTAGPSFYVFILNDGSDGSSRPLTLSIAQFCIAVIATLLFSIIPPGRMFDDRVVSKSREYLASQTFTASYPSMTRNQRLGSIIFWLLIFGCKSVESYYYLVLSFTDTVTVMSHMKIQGCNDRLFGTRLCSNHAALTLAIMFILDLVLFFLDTYVWYVVWSVVFSTSRSFVLGISIWTPWKDIFTHLPKRIYAKILATSDMEVKYKPKVLVTQVWNAVIISMYREHLLSIDHVQKLLYHQALSDTDGRDKLQGEFFPPGGEAARRISYFAQSVTTTIPEPLPVDAMPTFTVLTPHYSEKILLSLREIICEEDQSTRITLLQYLKQRHGIEWANFVGDTRIFIEETARINLDNSSGNDSEEMDGENETNGLPFDGFGFKSMSGELTLRTRIWASLRAQTLYRTVSGMMNYAKAIKLLYRVENPEVVLSFGGNTEKLERELERMARRKFKFVVAMQRYSKFNKVERENAEFLLRAYPDVQIAYLDEEPANNGGEARCFSVLIDGHSALIPETGRRRPKFRIELPGNPILGDGKSDNQNHAIIFYRGEYLQLIDANQDNYFEECLKIRNVLGEFEEFHTSNQNPYDQWTYRDLQKSPVAIVGAREYIFSESDGILGDVAAGKEQTFGTLTARTLAWIGGKLHYGHPDFLNATFMATRGGVSKAQRGLHLNEDIFAGMNAFGRGGRIKHVEYFQCGKGRDLGFGTVLNFQTKLGSGMAEQILSREYYYLGTQLPIDRFLTFYYGHPGFHLNNILIIFSVQLFIISLVFLGTLMESVPICSYVDGRLLSGQSGCYNLYPVFDWIKRCMISISLVSMISFLPLFIYELTERGVGRAVLRLAKHFLSLSPMFEVFAIQIQSNSILVNMSFGGARYIATGRGFPTARISFSILYSRFAGPSIYLGVRTLIMLLYVTMVLWVPHLLYFWILVAALVIAPFLFNPHQFSYSDFIIDYREFLRWMSRGNSRSHANSWIGYCRLSRTQVTGYKKKRLGYSSDRLCREMNRAGWRTVFASEIIAPLWLATITTIAYLFVKSFPKDGIYPPSPLVRLATVALGPLVWNAAVLLSIFIVSLTLGPVLNQYYPRFGAMMAMVAHSLAIIGHIAFFEFLWFLESWNAPHAVLGLVAIISIQRAIQKTFISVLISREFKHDETNRAWWTGQWYGRGLGMHAMSQPVREYFIKIVELSLWSSDFLLGHFLLFFLSLPIIIPFADKIHAIGLCKSSRLSINDLANSLDSLVASFTADSCASLLSQTKEATTKHCYQVYDCLLYRIYDICGFDCITHGLSFSTQDELQYLSNDLRRSLAFGSVI
ncbi:1,3-beta-glucan synthase [Rhizoctonia solani AG-3 Rhs1AP]|uniref:1,3-beta-glucan synthase n=1 Tax=Rhizoctonia solani AG-3 Rhs1AP TaxID=1086054 RepID=X8IXS0_9AGAM|nr:1,3-beta-glucan synthase [Rhizoctonia solani AG-3 Rhs1AP]